MVDQYSRTRMLLGEEALEKLHRSRVMIFGVGGVGQCVVEGLARAGVGRFELVDPDCVSLTNLNRQLFTTHENIGMNKAELGAQRIHQINPDAEVNVHKVFYLPGLEKEFDFASCDYIADAVDTVSAKIGIIMEAQRLGRPVISAMGCGNRLDPTLLRIDDIYRTQNDPLAKVMRRELNKRGVKHLKVCYSLELPLRPMKEFTEYEEDGAMDRYTEDGKETDMGNEWSPEKAGGMKADHAESPDKSAENGTVSGTRRRGVPGSTAFVPTAAGFAIAGCIVRDLTGCNIRK